MSHAPTNPTEEINRGGPSSGQVWPPRPPYEPGATAHDIALAPARPLRIALVTEYYYPHLGGVCEHVHFFAQQARLHGHHVDIITSNIPGAFNESGVIRIGRSQSVFANGSQARITIGFGLRKEMRNVLRRGNYDIVHVHSPLTPVLPLLAIDEAECPLVGTFHTYFDKSYGYQLGRKYFQRRLDKLSVAIAVSHSTIDVDLFNPNVPSPSGLRTDIPIILFLGRFDPRNGLTTLIEAFKHVRRTHEEVQLVVVGDGPLRRHYYRAAGKDPYITFVGPVLESRPRYYAHATVYVCPTTRASFGLTLLEAMACETPIICSDILGFRDVVKHERESLMVPCGDPRALADAIVLLLENESLRTRLGKAGRKIAEQYSWPKVTEKVLSLYDRVLNGH
jgi:phosphatidylinositol alpha-mannosyltransferase